MAQYILRRLALLIPVLLGVSLVVFTLVRLIPGDATLLAIGVDQRITAEQRELVRKSYGLDQPQPVQYAALDAARAAGRPGHLAAHPPLGQRGAAAAPAGDDRADAAGGAARHRPGDGGRRAGGRAAQLGARLRGHDRDADRRLRPEFPARDAARARLLDLAALAAADRLRRADEGPDRRICAP